MNHSKRKNLVLLKTIDDVERIIGFFSVCWYESGDRTVFGTSRYNRFVNLITTWVRWRLETLKFQRKHVIADQSKLSKLCVYRKISKALDTPKSQRIGFARLWKTNLKNIFSWEPLHHFEKYQWQIKTKKILLPKEKDMNSGLVETFHFGRSRYDPWKWLTNIKVR